MSLRRTVPGAAAALLAVTLLPARSIGAQAGVDAGCPTAPAPLPNVPTPGQAGQFYQRQLVRDACQKAIDLFQFMAPQLGTSVAGGNAVLGRGGAFGAIGKFSIGVRGNVVQGALPQLDAVSLSTNGPQRTNIPTESQFVGLPAAEVSVGVFPGIGIGLTKVGGVDAIVSGFYVPNLESDGFALRTDGGSFKLGFGGRLGILEETAVIPGDSVTYLRRDLPSINVTAEGQTNPGGQSDSVRISGLQARTTAWRLVASKRLPFIGFAVGAGQDTYDSRARLSAFVAPRTGLVSGVPYTTPAFNGEVASTQQKLTRTNYFADVMFNLYLFKLVGEVGQVSGGTVRETFNVFADRAAGDSYTYGALGLRFGF